VQDSENSHCGFLETETVYQILKQMAIIIEARFLHIDDEGNVRNPEGASEKARGG